MVGIDIVEIARISAAIEKYGGRFLDRIFTEDEITYAGDIKKRAHESLAGRFAVKEAFMKALGEKLPWKEINVLQTGGRPYVRFRGKRYEGVSISHERLYAVAAVVIQGSGFTPYDIERSQGPVVSQRRERSDQALTGGVDEEVIS